MSTQLPNGLSIKQANALAVGIPPSWHDFFGEPSVSPFADAVASSPAAIAARAVGALGAAGEQLSKKPEAAPTSTPLHRRKLHAPNKPARGRPAASVADVKAKVTSGRAAPLSEPVVLPTSGTPWGKIGVGVAGVAALIAAVVMFSDEDKPATEVGKDTKANTAPTTAPKPKPKPAADPSPKTAEPAPAEPAPAEPEPADAVEDPAPADPEPVANEPEPAPKANPPPGPLPRAPFPTPKPTPKKKKGGIVRDAPF